jgi:hypothetical protein
MGNLAVVMPKGLGVNGDVPRLATARTRHKEGREELGKGAEDI